MEASLKERMAAKRLVALDTPINLPIPGWADGSLVGVFTPIKDWAVVREFALTDDPEREVELAIGGILDHCEKTEAHVDGEVHELAPLGIELLKGLTGEDAATDADALVLLTPSPEDIMALYITLRDRSQSRVKATEDKLSGESRAS